MGYIHDIPSAYVRIRYNNLYPAVTFTKLVHYIE